MNVTLATLLFFLLCGGRLSIAADSRKSIDTEHSTLTVRVYKSGLLSGFGHEHEIHAPVQSGYLDEEKNAVEFSVNARSLRVIDRDVSDKDRAEIQATMLGPRVLDSDKFPEIKFRSTGVSSSADGKRTIHGELTLHGQTHPVDATADGASGHYRGSAVLRQKDFGITPVTVAGGAIKVKDEVRIEFEIVAKPER